MYSAIKDRNSNQKREFKEKMKLDNVMNFNLLVMVCMCGCRIPQSKSNFMKNKTHIYCNFCEKAKPY